jgi:hypothetical protein
MSLGWTVVGTIAQLMLALFLFMLVVFSASGVANDGSLGKFQLGILNLSIFLLPALCVLSALIVCMLHWRGAGAMAYWWYALPLVGTAVYLGYVIVLGRGAGP